MQDVETTGNQNAQKTPFPSNIGCLKTTSSLLGLAQLNEIRGIIKCDYGGKSEVRLKNKMFQGISTNGP